MADASPPVTLGPARRGIIALTLLTAAIHGILAIRAPGMLGIAFLMDAIVYVVLLAAAFAPNPHPVVIRIRPIAPTLLLVWTIATILAWLITGFGRNALGYIGKLVELALVAILTLDLIKSRPAT